MHSRVEAPLHSRSTTRPSSRAARRPSNRSEDRPNNQALFQRQLHHDVPHANLRFTPPTSRRASRYCFRPPRRRLANLRYNRVESLPSSLLLSQFECLANDLLANRSILLRVSPRTSRPDSPLFSRTGVQLDSHLRSRLYSHQCIQASPHLNCHPLNQRLSLHAFLRGSQLMRRLSSQVSIRFRCQVRFPRCNLRGNRPTNPSPNRPSIPRHIPAACQPRIPFNKESRRLTDHPRLLP